jgi:DNA repair exonuclease SbcCD ATPase subunit
MWLLAACLFARALVVADATEAMMLGNPVRKVVTMMQKMQATIEAEGKEKEKMFEEFMCYCKTGDKSLKESISAATDKIPQLESSIKEAKGSKAQLSADVESAKSDREEAKKTLGKAAAIRDKEATDFASEAAESKANINALAKSIPAIEKGMGGAFLQTNTRIYQRLQSLSVSMDMESVDRDLLASFLAGGSSSKGSGEILGILKQMKEDMEKDLAEATSDEEGKVKDYTSLVSAKKKEASALTKAVEDKTVREGGLAVDLANMANDLEDTKDNLAADQEMLANLDSSCKIKMKEWDEYKKMMAEELVALSDTIKLLNDDEALGLFKKTLPSSAASFMQVQVTAKSMQRRALALLKSLKRHRGHHDPRIDFLELALHGGKVGFDKILQMVDELMTVLKKEQSDDDTKKSYCLTEFDKYEDIKKGLILDISDVTKAIADSEESLKVIAKEIKATTTGIKDLDKSVAEATKTRKEENAQATKTLAENAATKDLLGLAKNRLNKFYNPKLHKKTAALQIGEDEQDTGNTESDIESTDAPGGVEGTSFVQVRAHRQAAGQPNANLEFKKKSEGSQGVITMIDILIGDVDKDTTVVETEEKEAQAEYETFMAEAKKKRALDAKSVTDKEGAKAEAETELEKNKMALKDKKVELVETDKFIMGLHQSCDFLLKFYDTRKEARADELESLDKAKAVLNGADYSFLQIGSVHLRGSK